jgi:excisionase family DNA binding protein
MGRAARSANLDLPVDQVQAVRELTRLLSPRGEAPRRLLLIDADGRQDEVPPATVAALAPALATLVAQLGERADPALLPDDVEVSTTQAAAYLGISRQYLARLLDRGAIPYRMVGSHHRLRLGDLRAYQTRQRAAIREVAHLSETLGLYDE